MKKRAVDLSVEELAAMGANAALKSSNDARDAGLPVIGVAEVRQGEHIVPVILQRSPSGIVTSLDLDHADSPAAISAVEISKRADD